MAVSGMDLVSVAVVVAILVGVMVYNGLRANRPQRAMSGRGGAVHGDAVLQRYVHHDGAIVGQAIAVEGGRVLLRQGATHKAVPQARLERAGDDLRLVGDIDWAAAQAEGAAWAARLAAAGRDGDDGAGAGSRTSAPPKSE